MSKTLQILIIGLIISGCTTKAVDPKIIVQTKVEFCPEDPPPECEEWVLKQKSDFEYNVELEDDWLLGQKIYGSCKPLWDTFTKGWYTCKEAVQKASH